MPWWPSATLRRPRCDAPIRDYLTPKGPPRSWRDGLAVLDRPELRRELDQAERLRGGGAFTDPSPIDGVASHQADQGIDRFRVQSESEG